jgi:hypothetical protein
VQDDDHDPARRGVLDGLRRLAVEAYGEDRAAETLLQMALNAAATAVWRVSQETLDVSDEPPYR